MLGSNNGNCNNTSSYDRGGEAPMEIDSPPPVWLSNSIISRSNSTSTKIFFHLILLTI
jgi:hypothetical protein